MNKSKIQKKSQNSRVSCTLDLAFETSLSHLPNLSRILEALLKMRELHENLAYEIITVINEIVSNSIQHAYLKKPDNIIRISISMDESAFTLVLFEENPLVHKDMIELTSINEFQESGGETGFGMALIHKYMDEVRRESIENGYKWTLRRSLTQD
ncbi:ATP-binding protein [Acidobacteriota bacterium]